MSIRQRHHLKQPAPRQRARRSIVVAVSALLGLLGSVAGAQSATPRDGATTSLLGSYLAGRYARGQNDTDAAAGYYRFALQRDPDNEVLLEQTFLLEATEANWAEAGRLAEQVVAKHATHRMARLYLGLAAFKAGKTEAAEEHFKAASNGPIGELTGTLAQAWAMTARGEAKAALEKLESVKQADWAQYFLRYHKALIADSTGRPAEARAAYERIFKSDQRTLRVALAYAQSLANAGDAKAARAVLQEHLKKTTNPHPAAKDMLDRLAVGPSQPLILSTSAEGLAEAFYGLGEALTAEGGLPIGAIYLQFALYMKPDFPFALTALAGVHETTKKYLLANSAYDRVPKGTAMASAIEIRKALNLNQLEKVDEAKATLEKVAAANPGDLRVYDALGNIMRGHKRFKEAADYYSRAIATITKPEKQHWTYYYQRGTCYERLKQWSLAEADLQRAMKLAPDQALVLNYLGYSWVDQGRNLKQGLGLIEKAVQLKPDDGYIVDSLGWAHYKLGNFKEAVKHLDRAVELKPDDPVLNDHLGDGFWQVGRTMEARFQWEQALTLKPEPEDAAKIKVKLAKGLQPEPSSALAPAKIAKKKPREGARADVRKRPATGESSPGLPIQ